MPDFNLFEPTTEIYLSSTGIDDYNKVYFYNNVIAGSWVIERAVGSFSEYSYQRADERQYCAVYGNYYDYIGCDTICWVNTNASLESGQYFYIIGNITQLEWKNPNCFWVWFKVDPYMTYCGNIDWDNSYCYVEREHIENDWNGERPYWSNLGVAEDIAIEPEVSSTLLTRYFTPDCIVISSPYDQSGQLNAAGYFQQNVFTGLNTYIFRSESEANAYIQTIENSSEATVENIVSIKSVPSEFVDGLVREAVQAPTPPWVTYSGRIYNAKCFTSQFCVLQVDSTLAETKRYAPEYFVGLSGDGTPSFLEYKMLGGSVCGLILNPMGYGFIMSEISALSNAFVIDEVPEGVCVGNAYAEWRASQGNYVIANAIANGISGVIGGVTGASTNPTVVSSPATAAVSATGSIVSSAISAAQKFAQAKKYGSCLIGSANTSANVAAATGWYGYNISWITPFTPNLYALDDYFSRYGYQVNRLKVPNVNTRPHWNYVKTGEAHIQGDVPYLYRVQIENMLNHGVTFWNADWTIGDYSDPAGNMG